LIAFNRVPAYELSVVGYDLFDLKRENQHSPTLTAK